MPLSHLKILENISSVRIFFFFGVVFFFVRIFISLQIFFSYTYIYLTCISTFSYVFIYVCKINRSLIFKINSFLFARPVDWTAQWLLSNWSKMFECLRQFAAAADFMCVLYMCVCMVTTFYMYIQDPMMICFVEKRRENVVLVCVCVCCVSRINLYEEKISCLYPTTRLLHTYSDIPQ